MPDSTPEFEVVGPPILTIYFKNKKDDEGNPMAGAQEVMDFNVSGGALIAQNMDGEFMVFPLAELEYASLTPQISTKEAADAPDSGDDHGSAEAEGKLIVPNFGGGGSDSEEGGS